MDSRFLPHNSHLSDPDGFAKLDPQLRQLQRRTYVYRSPILDQLPIDQPGIYTLGGGRQVGKSTLLKQWMAKLLADGILPHAIAFFSGELIDDAHALLRLLQQQLANMPTDRMLYLLIDEVTYIKDWDKAVKYAADAGMLENVELIVTGSELVMIQEARMRFPGRRGKAPMVNFHLYPLSFYEVVSMKKVLAEEIDNIDSANISPKITEILSTEFNNYLLHGGYLTAINDMAEKGCILKATLDIYSDWIRGDVLKRGKQEQYLREVLAALVKRYGSQLTWNALARDLSIDHHKTVADYIELLSSMDALFVQSALLEDKLVAAPKKAKKVVFLDPFIFHAIRTWLTEEDDPYISQILPVLEDAELSSRLVEGVVAAHYYRFYPTYYIKAEGEVDVAYVKHNKFWPVEVKWTNELHTKDLKQISKYKNGVILAKSRQTRVINNVKTEFLPLALLKIRG